MTSSRHARTSNSHTRRRSRRSPLPRSEIAAARAALAEAYLRTGDYDGVDAHLDEALAAASEDPKLEADALAIRGMTLHFRAIDLSPDERAELDPGPEEALFRQALDKRRALDDREGVAESLFQLGLVEQVLRRDLESGAPYMRAALAVVDGVRDADVLLRSEIHRHVGFDALLRKERAEEARTHLRRSLELRQKLPERGWLASAHVALSLCERLAGRRAQAIEHAQRAVDVIEAEGLRERFLDSAREALREAQALPS